MRGDFPSPLIFSDALRNNFTLTPIGMKMPEQMRLKVGIATFSYGGNGGMKSEHPDVRDWMIQTICKAQKDPRISKIGHFDLADTPITMTRNQAVLKARENKVDVLVMIDSDMGPDSELGTDPEAKPFFETAFDFLYNHWHKGPVCVAAPYCGPPPNENVYVFQWDNYNNDQVDGNFKLDAYTRAHAGMMTGIAPIAAAPTGLIMYDMRCFELTEPRDANSKPWFYYEWTDKYQAYKSSTEDVTQTRDLSLAGQQILGYNPVFCAWNSWAKHWKPIGVRKPRPMTADKVKDKFVEAFAGGYQSDERETYVSIKHSIDPMEFGEVVAIGSHDMSPARVSFEQKSPERKLAHMRVLEKALDNGEEVNGSKDDRQALAELVRLTVKNKPNAVIVEVGCFDGVGSKTIVENMGLEARLYCIDHFQGAEYDITKRMVEHLGGPDAIYERWEKNVGQKNIPLRVDAIRKSSLEVAASGRFTNGIDLIYIDAGHTYKEVKEDITAWSKLINPGGIIAGHDYGNTFIGVKEAVDELIDNPQLAGTCVWFAPIENCHAN
jgi:predicted O-methyltransferase YrrM